MRPKETRRGRGNHQRDGRRRRDGTGTAATRPSSSGDAYLPGGGRDRPPHPMGPSGGRTHHRAARIDPSRRAKRAPAEAKSQLNKDLRLGQAGPAFLRQVRYGREWWSMPANGRAGPGRQLGWPARPGLPTERCPEPSERHDPPLDDARFTRTVAPPTIRPRRIIPSGSEQRTRRVDGIAPGLSPFRRVSRAQNQHRPRTARPRRRLRRRRRQQQRDP